MNCIYGYASATCKITTGSILGPLLVLIYIYINDLPTVTQLVHMLMYADDTTLYHNVKQNANEHEINNEFNRVSDWVSSNKL